MRTPNTERLRHDDLPVTLHDGNGRQDPYGLESPGAWTTTGFFRVIDEPAADGAAQL